MRTDRSVFLTREERQAEPKKPDFDFPAYNVTCDGISKAEDEHMGQLLTMAYLGVEHDGHALAARTHQDPDKIVSTVELSEKSSDGQAQFLIRFSLTHLYVVKNFLCAEIGDEQKPVVLRKGQGTIIGDHTGPSYDVMLKRIAERNEGLKRTLSSSQHATFLDIINRLEPVFTTEKRRWISAFSSDRSTLFTAPPS